MALIDGLGGMKTWTPDEQAHLDSPIIGGTPTKSEIAEAEKVIKDINRKANIANKIGSLAKQKGPQVFIDLATAIGKKGGDDETLAWLMDVQQQVEDELGKDWWKQVPPQEVLDEETTKDT